MSKSNIAKEPTTQLAKPTERKAPCVDTGDSQELKITVDHENQLRDLYGVKTQAAGKALLLSALNALGAGGALYRDLMAVIAEELEPRDAIEAMLISQQVATHVAMTSMSCRVMDASNPKIRESYERSMTRLSRTFIAQTDALKKYRAKAQQVVRVERVTVNEGGQAIVGPVSHGGSDDKGK